MPNKVTFGIKNVHYAPLTIASNGTVIYEQPQPFPGAVSIGLEQLGELVEFYADNILYWAGAENSGYQGPFVSARVPDDFRVNILGDTISPNGLLVENAGAFPRNFALLFEFSGDQSARRVVLYNCSVQRPGISSTTNTRTKTPNEPSMQITAAPRPDGIVRAFSTDDTDQDVYDSWYTAVPEPGESNVPQLSALTVGDEVLSPVFDPDTTSYTASLSSASSTVTATAPEGATVIVAVNGNSIANGGRAAWNLGANTLTVTVTKDGIQNIYAVAVTRR